MLAVHPNAVRSALGSTRALFVNATLVTAWLVLSLVVLPRFVRSTAPRSALLTVVSIAAIAVLVVPTLRDTRVDEAFPEVALTRGGPPHDVLMDALAPDTTATTSRPMPVLLSTGSLHGIDHDARGTASVYRRSDGSLVVALEDIDIEPGPDYRVLAAPGRDRRSDAGATELAALKGNQGTQYYEVPTGVDVGPGATVLIWCRAFGVPIANATQD
jgi:hypothetical protein